MTDNICTQLRPDTSLIHWSFKIAICTTRKPGQKKSTSRKGLKLLFLSLVITGYNLQVWLCCCFSIFIFEPAVPKRHKQMTLPSITPCQSNRRADISVPLLKYTFLCYLVSPLRWCISVCCEIIPAVVLLPCKGRNHPSIELVLTMLSINFIINFLFAIPLCFSLSSCALFHHFPVIWFLHIMWYASDQLPSSPLLHDSYLFIPIFIDSDVEPSSVWWQTNVLDFKSYH